MLMRRNFALLHGEMNDFMRPGAIARRVNVRRARLHELIGHDATVLAGDPGSSQVERRRVRHAAQRE